MKRYLHANNAFISTYFLAMLLCISVICMIVIENDIYDLKTIENIKIANTYFEIESYVIKDIKCRLLNDTLEPYVSLNNEHYSLTITDSVLYVTLHGELYEELQVVYDFETKKIIRYTSTRYVGNN